MRKMPWVMYLWPGLPLLWRFGSWPGLVLAVTAAAVFDLLLLGSAGWSELISQNMRTAMWGACVVVWLLAVGWSIRSYRRHEAAGKRTPDKDIFGEALNHYLKGDNFQTELLCETLLRANARDVEARLMLATLLRHTGRGDEAAQHLDTLVRFDGAAKWELEIEHERGLLAETKRRTATTVAPAETTAEEQHDGVAHAA